MLPVRPPRNSYMMSKQHDPLELGIDRDALRRVLREIHLADLHLRNSVVPVPERGWLSIGDRYRSCDVLGKVEDIVGVVLSLFWSHDLCINSPPRV